MQKPRNICLLRLSAIGDVCHAVAVAQAILRCWPEVPVTWVIGHLEASLLRELLPQIEFIEFDKQAGWRAYRDLRRTLRGRKFDVCLHMQMALRASLVSVCIPAKIKMGFDRKRAKDKQWLFTNRKIAHQARQHVVESFWGFLETLGLPKQTIRWAVDVPQPTLEWASQHIHDQPTLLINAAASFSCRNWTVEGYAAVAKHALAQGLQVILTGGPSELEQQLAADIISASDPRVQSLVGQTSLLQLLGLIAQANVVLAPDTGPAHMATMVGTPVIGLHAGTNPDRTRAYNSAEFVVSAYPQALMQHCGKTADQLPWGTRIREAWPMALIQQEAVCDMLDKVLAQQQKPIEPIPVIQGEHVEYAAYRL